METETSYSYVSGTSGSTGSCKVVSSKNAVGIKGYYAVSSQTTAKGIEADMANYVLNVGPISVCLAASAWNSYSSGIMSAGTCGTSVNHCVQAVGVNTGAATPYWILRNQWNTNWGMGGFIWVAYGTNTCVLTCESTYTVPFVVNPPGPTFLPVPSPNPSSRPSKQPTLQPSYKPTPVPLKPSSPTAKPSTTKPTIKPTVPVPTALPTSISLAGAPTPVPVGVEI